MSLELSCIDFDRIFSRQIEWLRMGLWLSCVKFDRVFSEPTVSKGAGVELAGIEPRVSRGFSRQIKLSRANGFEWAWSRAVSSLICFSLRKSDGFECVCG